MSAARGAHTGCRPDAIAATADISDRVQKTRFPGTPTDRPKVYLPFGFRRDYNLAKCLIFGRAVLMRSFHTGS